MADEKNLAASPIAEQDLDQVTGGYEETIHIRETDKYYRYAPKNSNDKNLQYLCPNCKRPVHIGWWGRYFCDPCNASWGNLERIIPNVNGGPWEEITKEQYDKENFTFGPVLQ